MSKQPATDEQSGPVYKAMKLAAWGLFLYGIGLSMSHIYGLFTWLHAAPVTADDVEGAFRLECHGGGQCPTDVAPGQTWRLQGDALAEGERHLLNHLTEEM